MKIYKKCFPCFDKQLESALMHIDKGLHNEIRQEVQELFANIDVSLSPPEIAGEMFTIIDKWTNGLDTYYDIKEKSNKYILDMCDELSALIANSDDAFVTALKLAITGNIIDYGAKNNYSETEIHNELELGLSAKYANENIEKLRNEIDKAKSILYLADNAGEIVFDKLFIEQLPMEKIILAVRGKPAINDALIKDAKDVGLDKIVKVIDNGAGYPGTVLNKCSDEFIKVFNNADLIISKGQGNYETLSDVNANIFFLLRAKCPVVAEDLNAQIGDFIIYSKRMK